MIPKPRPRVLEKADKRKAIEQHRRDMKKAIFARDNGRCRCCGGTAHEMHELRFRSLGGERSLENSIALCNYRGKNCHRLIQTHVISAEPLDGRFGANGLIAFTDNQTGRIWTR